MSQSSTQLLPCPACRQQVPWEVHTSVNVTKDPSLKLRVLKNELGRFSCPHCSAVAFLSQPLLYHDMDLHLMIQLAPQTDLDVSGISNLLSVTQGMVTRVVSSWNELREKVILFDSHLDDRAIEAVKLLARTKYPELAGDEILFEEIDGEDFLFAALGSDEPRGFSLPKSLYQSVRADLERRGLLPSEDEHWQRIDGAFAAKILRHIAGAPIAQA